MTVLVDTNVVLDVVSDGSPFAAWSASLLMEHARTAGIVVNPVVYAELAPAFGSQAYLDAFLNGGSFALEHLPWEAAFRTGQVYKDYLQRGGARTSPLADFFIGAHAEVQSYAIMTRDTAKYRSYFPTVPLITPETHPS